jgi:hypothetical protein
MTAVPTTLLVWLVASSATRRHGYTATESGPCRTVLSAAHPGAISDSVWLACYQSQAPALIGGYTIRGTNHWKNGSNLPFVVERACICSCEGTVDGVVCNGTIGSQTGEPSPSDSSSFTMFAFIPDATISSRQPSAPVVWRGRQRSLSDSNVENIYFRQELEWADGLLSNRTSTGQGWAPTPVVASPVCLPAMVFWTGIYLCHQCSCHGHIRSRWRSSLGGAAAFEVMQWRARESASTCERPQGQADLKCDPHALPRQLCPGMQPCPASGRCPARGLPRSCAVGPDALCSEYKLPVEPIIHKCNLSSSQHQAAVGSGATAAQPNQRRQEQSFVQHEFVLSGYLDPPLNDVSYAALASANFTGVFGDRTCMYAGGNPRECAANGKLQAALCAKHGLASCYPGVPSAPAVPLSGSVRGYYLRDEPHARDFKELSKTVASVHQIRPGALVFVNLLGGYMASPQAALAWWGVPSYDEYVDEYIKTVQPDILCFDLYPDFGDCGWAVRGGDVNRSADTRDRYLHNLAFINNRSRMHNLSFWNYFDNQAQGSSCGPTRGKVAWQMFAAALHGSRGLLHFLITPCKSPKNCGHYHRHSNSATATGVASDNRDGGGDGRADPGYPSILTPEGGVPFPDFPPFVNARALNSRLKALGPHLMRMRTCSSGVISNCTMESCKSECQVYLRAIVDKDPAPKLAAARLPLVNISVGDFNLARFDYEDDSKRNDISSFGMMLQNHDASNFRFATVVWASMNGSRSPCLEVGQHDGLAKAPEDAAPHVDGFQIELGAGEARLYLC